MTTTAASSAPCRSARGAAEPHRRHDRNRHRSVALRQVRASGCARRGRDRRAAPRRTAAQWGRGHVAPPLRARSSARPLAPRRDAPVDRFDALQRLAGRDPGLIKSVKRLRSIGDHNLPVLLHGETGVGKDVFARAIHAASNRARNNYVALNCAAMPESLIDAELFGYEAGAFTGARRDGSKGLIVQADGGTLFLDEIGDMPIALQNALAARAGEPRGLAARCAQAGAGRHSPDQRHPPRSRPHGRGGRLPRRSLFPPARHGGAAAGVARTRRPGRCHPPDRERGGAQLPPVGGGLVAAVGLSVSRQHAPSSATCCGLPAARRRTASSRMPISISPPFGGRAAEPDLAAAERATIVDALRKHGGRVTEAARALKLSRATLYRKIKQLKIETAAVTRRLTLPCGEARSAALEHVGSFPCSLSHALPAGRRESTAMRALLRKIAPAQMPRDRDRRRSRCRASRAGVEAAAQIDQRRSAPPNATHRAPRRRRSNASSSRIPAPARNRMRRQHPSAPARR